MVTTFSMRLYGKLDPSVSYSDDRRGDWDSKRRILERQTSKKTYVKSSINENYTFFMHAMVFIINGECDMALGDQLNAKTEQELIDDGAFINALVEKLAAGVGNSGVYTKTAANTAFVKTDGSNISTQADKGKALADAILAVQDNNKKSALVDKLGGFLDAADAVYGASSNQAAKAFLADKYPFVKTADLGAKVAEKAVVDVLVPALATVGTDDTKKVYTKSVADTAFAKIDASNLTEAANKKAFAEAILPAEDNKKSILVNKLGEALDRVKNDANDKVYGTDLANLKIAKDFLADKYPFVKTADLGTKVAEKAVVDVLVPALATVGTDDTKKVYTKSVADTAFAKIDASNLTDAANKKAFAEAILPAQDGDKSILVDKLGDAIASTDKAEYNVGTEQTAKQFLNSRGLILSEDAIFTRLTSNDNFKTSVAMNVNASDTGFQNAVREVMSQPRFEIPGEADVPISADW